MLIAPQMIQTSSSQPDLRLPMSFPSRNEQLLNLRLRPSQCLLFGYICILLRSNIRLVVVGNHKLEKVYLDCRVLSIAVVSNLHQPSLNRCFPCSTILSRQRLHCHPKQWFREVLEQSYLSFRLANLLLLLSLPNNYAGTNHLTKLAMNQHTLVGSS